MQSLNRNRGSQDLASSCIIYVYLSKSYDLNCHDFQLGPLFRVPRAVIGPILAPSEGQEERTEMDDVEVDEATTDQDTLNKVSKPVKHVMFTKKRVWKFEMFLEKPQNSSL